MPATTNKRGRTQSKAKAGKGDEATKHVKQAAAPDASVPDDTKRIGKYLAHEIGVYTADAADKLDESTWEVDFKAIAFGKKLPWFMEYVSNQEKEGFQLPQESHGFSRVLTNVHRAHPSLIYSWEEPPVKKGGPPVINVYKVRSYESAGVWRDSDGVPCLVVQALYIEPGLPPEKEVHLLYESGARDSEASLVEDNATDLWAVTSVGSGGHLKKLGGKIQLDNPCKAPKGE